MAWGYIHITSFLEQFQFFVQIRCFCHVRLHPWPYLSLMWTHLSPKCPGCAHFLGNCFKYYSVSLGSFWFCLNPFPKYPVNHQFPNPSTKYSHFCCCPSLLNHDDSDMHVHVKVCWEKNTEIPIWLFPFMLCHGYIYIHTLIILMRKKTLIVYFNLCTECFS